MDSSSSTSPSSSSSNVSTVSSPLPSSSTTLSSPLHRLSQEIGELVLALPLLPQSNSQPWNEFTRLRQGLDAQAQLIVHETARFGLLFKSLNLPSSSSSSSSSASTSSSLSSYADKASLEAVGKSMEEVLTKFVSIIQVLSLPYHLLLVPPSLLSLPSLILGSRLCRGSLFHTEIQKHGKLILTTIQEMIHFATVPLPTNVPSPKKGSSSSSLSVAVDHQSNVILTTVGKIIQLCENFPKLPKTPLAAIKRKLMNTAKLVKTSGNEIATDHKLRNSSNVSSSSSSSSSSVPTSSPSQEFLSHGLSILRAILDLLKLSIDTLDHTTVYDTQRLSTSSTASTTSSANMMITPTSNDTLLIELPFDKFVTDAENIQDKGIDFADALNTLFDNDDDEDDLDIEDDGDDSDIEDDEGEKDKGKKNTASLSSTSDPGFTKNKLDAFLSTLDDLVTILVAFAGSNEEALQIMKAMITSSTDTVTNSSPSSLSLVTTIDTILGSIRTVRTATLDYQQKLHTSPLVNTE